MVFMSQRHNEDMLFVKKTKNPELKNFERDNRELLIFFSNFLTSLKFNFGSTKKIHYN